MVCELTKPKCNYFGRRLLGDKAEALASPHVRPGSRPGRSSAARVSGRSQDDESARGGADLTIKDARLRWSYSKRHQIDAACGGVVPLRRWAALRHDCASALVRPQPFAEGNLSVVVFTDPAGAMSSASGSSVRPADEPLQPSASVICRHAGPPIPLLQ